MYVGGRTFAFLLLILATLVVSCAETQNGEIANGGGEGVRLTEDYPAVVMVILPEGRGICSGTFISERAVLTASHCVKANGRYQVVSSFGTFSSYTRVAFGPGVVDDPNDIAILIFNEPVASRKKGQVMDLAVSVRSGDRFKLVGFGCDNLFTRDGGGEKREGENRGELTGGYLVFFTQLANGGRGIIGPYGQAGSCFGDSGGPALAASNGSLSDPKSTLVVAGVTHAGGRSGNEAISEYCDMTRSDNQNFVREVNEKYDLGIRI